MLLIYISIAMFLVGLLVIKRREEEYQKEKIKIDREEAEIDKEMVIHQALERAGALPNHHHLEEQIKEENIRLKNIYYKNIFYLISYSIIAVEIWYLYLSIKAIVAS